MGLGMRRRGLCSDGSWPETDPSAGGAIVTSRASISRRLWLVRVADLSILATIRAQTLPFLIITPHPSLLLVALPCDSWPQSW